MQYTNGFKGVGSYAVSVQSILLPRRILIDFICFLHSRAENFMSHIHFRV